MNHLILALSLLLTPSAFAAKPAYQLNMDLSVNGEHISSPSVVVESGHTASLVQKISTGKEFIDVVATENLSSGHAGILMKFVIGSIDQNGKRTVTNSPQIIAQEGKAATITVQTAGKESLNLSVLAHKQVL